MEPKEYERMVPKIRQEGRQLWRHQTTPAWVRSWEVRLWIVVWELKLIKGSGVAAADCASCQKCRSAAVRAADIIWPSSGKEEQVCSLNAGANFLECAWTSELLVSMTGDISTANKYRQLRGAPYFSFRFIDRSFSVDVSLSLERSEWKCWPLLGHPWCSASTNTYLLT